MKFCKDFAGLLVMLVVCAAPLIGDSYITTERTITKLADDVYEIRHPDAPDGFPQGNTTVVIGERGVLVVDSCLLPSSARQDIDQIRQWTNKPVTYLVNTHWHFDHTLGNATYVAAFPSIQIVSQKETQRLIGDVNPGDLARYPQREERTKRALDSGKKSDGTPLTQGERKRYEKRLAGLKATLDEFKTTFQFIPNVSFNSELNIDLGNRPVQIRFLGKGNTSGDAIVYLPAQKVLAAGDLLDHPVPYLFGDLSVDHVTTLLLLAQLDVETIVPGHGEVLHGKDYVYQVINLLKEVNSEVEKEVNAGADTSEEVQQMLPKAIDLDKWRQKFVGNDAANASFFDVNIHSLIESAFQQISAR